MRIVLEPERNLATFLAARLVFLTALLGVAALFHGTRSLVTYLLLFAANAFLSLGCWEWARRTQVSTLLSGCAVTGAIILDTIVLRYTGGGESEFIFLYFFSVGSAGMLIGMGGGLWAAALSIAGTFWIFGGGQPGFLNESGLRVFVYAINYVLTAAIAAYVFDWIKKSEQRHRMALGELEQIKLDTQAILDSLSTGVLVTDQSGDILYSNPAGHRILGITETTPVIHLKQLMSKDSVFGAAVRRLSNMPPQESRDEVVVNVGGSARPIGLSVSVLRDVAAQPRGNIVLFNDLTRIKDRERAEREQERLAAIGMLSQDLAHEIRNPLATVRGCVEMIKMAEGDPESEGECPFLNLALKESDRLNHLLQDFLTFANLRAPTKSRCDLLKLIMERCANRPAVVRSANDTGNSLQLDLDVEQISMAVDGILLALSEWGDGATIEVETSEAPARTVRFGVRELTISPEVCAEAFRPFSGVNKQHGSLLLPTAWRVIQAHGGKLNLKSNAAEGTWFELTL